MPIVESRSRRAAAPKNSNGTVVTGPLSISRPRVPTLPCVSLPSRSKIPKVGQRDRRHGEGLHGEAHQSVDGHDLPHQGVQGERQRQGQSDPRHLAHETRQHQHAGQGHSDAQHLVGPQPLAEKYDAQQHVDQRVDEVAQAGLEHLAAG